MDPRTLAGACAVALALALPVSGQITVPTPADLTARVIVSGRASTPIEVPVVGIGAVIPPTYSGDRIHGTEGFSWWVSQHYALKTDYPEDRARHLLTLLELAYPHYVALFGREPEAIAERRFAVCYAASRESLDRALKDDGITWDFGGGGITYEGTNCAYCYPSGSLQYHQRYILLHECVHQFQQSLVGSCRVTPSWYYEGIADLFGSHVLEGDGARLTLNVLDKATTHNVLDEGLAALAETGLTASAVHERGGADRGVNAVLIAFLSSTPERAAKLAAWRDEMHRLRQSGDDLRATSSRVLQELYGPWEEIDRAFAAWTAGVRNTFHYAEWGWEQDGDTLWSYGFAPEEKLSRTDVNLPPGEVVEYSPFRLDYPATALPPALLGEIRSGGAEPSVGAVLDFGRNPGRGLCGLGLGLLASETEAAGPGFLKVLLDAEETLRVDGADLGLTVDSAPLPEELRAAMAASGHRVGLTITIGSDRLAIDLRAGAEGATEPVLAHWEYGLDATARERVLSRPYTILARGGYHGVTPCFAVGRRPEPDLTLPAPPNRWRNPGHGRLCAAVAACWRLGDRAPAALAAMRGRLVETAEDADARSASVAAFDAALPELLAAVDAAGAAEEATALAREALARAGER